MLLILYVHTVQQRVSAGQANFYFVPLRDESKKDRDVTCVIVTESPKSASYSSVSNPRLQILSALTESIRHGKTLHRENASQPGQPVVVACVFLSNDELDGCDRVRV